MGASIAHNSMDLCRLGRWGALAAQATHKQAVLWRRLWAAVEEGCMAAWVGSAAMECRSEAVDRAWAVGRA